MTLIDRIFAALTGIPTLRCDCGYTTRCGYQLGQHVEGHDREAVAA